MSALFSQPLGTVNAEHVRGLIGWPESAIVEFKKDLPTKEGRPDSWYAGGGIGGYAKQAIFKEVVALANSSGGHVILGVKETSEKPAAAESINPIPRCADLAERLDRAAQSIDPPIMGLGVVGVPMSEEGSGVVIFRVPASISAPHRSIDKDCYVRRGTSSVPVSMREIQEMTVASLRREDRINARFSRAASDFARWVEVIPSNVPLVVGLRITAVASGSSFNLGRLFSKAGLLPQKQSYKLRVGNNPSEAHVYRMPHSERPIVRGTRWSDNSERTRIDLYSDGTVDIGIKIPPSEGLTILPIEWVLAYLVTALKAAHSLRSLAGLPDCECEIEIETRLTSAGGTINLVGFERPLYPCDVLGSLPGTPSTMPRLSFGPFSELDEVLTACYTDFLDAAGVRYKDPLTVSLIS